MGFEQLRLSIVQYRTTVFLELGWPYRDLRANESFSQFQKIDENFLF